MGVQSSSWWVGFFAVSGEELGDNTSRLGHKVCSSSTMPISKPGSLRKTRVIPARSGASKRLSVEGFLDGA